MELDEKTLATLKRALAALNDDSARPVGQDWLAPLAELAQPGTRLRVDLEASRTLGAPLVTVARTSQPHLLDALTPRQKDVARLVMAGLSNRDIASELGISVATVKDHVHAILDRLDLPSRAALIAATRG